jgi:DNA-binding MarR family transcriptional regulator
MSSLNSAPIRIAALIERIGRFARAREAATLPPAQWEALRFIARANSFSRQPSAVAAWLATTRGTASQTLMALERKGLIRKARHPSDGRITCLEATLAGQMLLEEDPMHRLEEAIARLPPLYAAALSQSLAHIAGDLAPQGATPVFAGCAGCRHLEAKGMGKHCLNFEADLSGEEAMLACVAHSPD